MDNPDATPVPINRVDVYGSNCASSSFFERHIDYCGGCAFADIDFHPAAPFPESGFRQHLSVYDAALAIDGAGVRAHPVADLTRSSSRHRRLSIRKPTLCDF